MDALSTGREPVGGGPRRGAGLAAALRRPEVAGPALAALAAFLLHASCGARYGIFRDELYYLACGERLAAGYVDQPPLVALVARAAHIAFGAWIPGLRLLSWLAAAATVFLAGRLAARLGAGAAGATLAAVATAAAPAMLGLGHYLTMNAFEPLLWLAIASVLAGRAGGGDERLLAAAGALAGLASLNKYTAVLFALCLLVGLLATPARAALATRWTAAGVALAVLAILPNAAWQAAREFPFLELVRNGQVHKNAPFSLPAFLGALLLETNPVAAPLWLGGMAWLLAARAARPVRFLGVGAAVLLVLLAAVRAKSYYAAPLEPILFAAGGAAAERALRWRWARRAAPAALALSGLALAPLALPLLPPEGLVAWMAVTGLRPPRLERHRESPLPQVAADQFGWEEMARAVARVADRLVPEERAVALVFGQNYGEAAAIDFFRSRYHLPPAVSGHNSYFLWGIPSGRGAVVIVISDENEDCGGGYWRRKELAARIPENRWAMPYESGRRIWICRDPIGPPEVLWPRVRLYI